MNLGFFASGSGSNFEAVAKRCLSGEITATPAMLICNVEGAGVFERAERLQVPSYLVRREDFTDGRDFAARLLEILHEHRVELILLAGYLRKLPPAVLRAFPNRVLNIHPALLPAFGGKGMYGHRVHEAVLAAGCRITGVTVHLVDEEYDHGPIVLQREVEIQKDDTPETLAARVLEVEHQIYGDAVKLFVENRLSIERGQVRILGGSIL
ncbi:MAG: phosphoribosylglycinamide formyltransferase [Calditrichaeota bacterium]|nr:phosphoribosylglycinamide formyltransferase [Calditrichota bacterium]